MANAMKEMCLVLAHFLHCINHFFCFIYMWVFKPIAVFSVILSGESLWQAHSKSELFIFVNYVILALKPN